MTDVYAIADRTTNAELFADVAKLGYLNGRVLDCTFKHGRFWTEHQPAPLHRHDLDPRYAPDGPMDFTAIAYRTNTFDSVVFDPPYKLNGTPSSGGPANSDRDYGVDTYTRWQDRIALIERGIPECVRVAKPGGFLLLKCQDQVCSGQVRWQTRIFADRAEAEGSRLVDRFDLVGGRKQSGRQVHARRNHSTLLIFRKHQR